VSELKKLVQSHEQWPAHPIVDSPGGGEHHIFLNTCRLGNSAGGFRGLGIDIRGFGGYIVAPGTANQNGRWAPRAGTPDLIQAVQDGSLPNVPDWVVDLIKQTDRDQPTLADILQFPVRPGSADTNHINVIVRNEVDRVKSSPTGTRNETLNKAAFTIGGLLHTGMLDIGQAYHQLYVAAIACGLAEGADGDRAIRATIESGLAAGQHQPFAPGEQSVAQTQALGLALAEKASQSRAATNVATVAVAEPWEEPQDLFPQPQAGYQEFPIDSLHCC
jgi:hypothetical protein